MHVAAEVLRDAPALPAAGAQIGFGVVREPRRGEDQRNAVSAVVSSSTPGVLQTVDAESRAAAGVDVVEPDRDVRDHAQAREPRAGREHLGVDLVGEHRDDRVDITGVRDQLVVRVRRVVGIRADELVARERIRARRREDGG